MHPDDASLVSRLRAAGDDRESAVAELRATLARGLAKALGSRYGRHDQIDDIVQESLLKVLASLDKFEGRSRFVTWAMTVATRVGISTLRRRYHRDQSLEAFDTGDGGRIDLPDTREGPIGAGAERGEVLATLRRLIDEELTERQRVAVRAMLSGYSTDGLAERLGTNRNAVYKLVHDARSRLKEGFSRLGVTSEDVAAALV